MKTTGTVAACLLVGLLSYLAYQPVLDNQLLRTWDTNWYVLYNDHIRELSAANLAWMLTSFEVSNWHPLTWLSHAIDYALFGLDPSGHHAVNLLFHTLNALLVFFLARLVFRLAALQGGQVLAPSGQSFAAFAAAALFAVHPQHVESVAWVAQRKDLLCLFFSLLTLIGYLRYASSSRPLRVRWYSMTLAFFALALLSKPMAVSLPLVLLLLDAYPLRRIGADKGLALGRLLLEKAPLFVMAAAVAALTFLAQDSGGSVASLAAKGPAERLLNALNGVFFYLSKLVLPMGLSPFYAYPKMTATGFSIADALPLFAFMLVSALTVLAWRRQRPEWLVIWLYYLVTLAPVAGIVQVGEQSAADRYAYLTTLPFYLLAGAALGRSALGPGTSRLRQTMALVVVLLSLALLTGLTRKQADVWQNDVTLWSRAAALDPANAYAWFRLGDAFVEYGVPDRAIGAYRAALALDPGHLWYGINLPGALLALERFSEALEQVDILIDNDVTAGVGVDRLLVRRAQALAGLGRLDEARATLQDALSRNPENMQAVELLASLPP